MDRNTPFTEPCCGAYDARHISSVLRFLLQKSQGMDASVRAVFLARASRLPGLHGRFIEHLGGLAFRPDDGGALVLNEEGR
jgi:hypothetical protein